MTTEDNVELQWEEWQAANDTEPYLNIEDEILRQKIIKDLSFVSAMDVKEYVLYQKWCEIQEKYPTIMVENGLDGPEKYLVDDEVDTKRKFLDNVRNNIWIPKSPEDYMKLKPVLEFTDDSGEESIIGVDKTTSAKEIKRSNLPEKWNALRTLIHTQKNNSNIGRNLNFIVKDSITEKYLGVTCISSDFLDLTPRDKAIGWERKKKTQGHMINYTAIASTIVPVQPFGYNAVGGKLLALLCLSDDVQSLWKKKYGDVLVGVTTTSLYGKAKENHLSQYDRLTHWKNMGFSAGSVGFEPSRETLNLIKEWLRKHHTRKYFEWWCAKKGSGQPYKRDHKNRSLAFVYGKLNIPNNLVRANHQRGIYFSKLYDNSFDFLRGDITEDKLIKSFDTSYDALTTIWKEKYLMKRLTSMTEKGRLSEEVLFYDDLIYLTWDETKAKYLTQVGR